MVMGFVGVPTRSIVEWRPTPVLGGGVMWWEFCEDFRISGNSNLVK